MARRNDQPGAPAIGNREQALAFLFGRINYERTAPPYRSRDFKLDRMRQLAEELGNPQERFPVVHVAGTKGKGSTSAMIAGVLRAAGYRTGLYCSPHLDRIEERWTIDGRLCSERQLVELMQRVAPVVQSMDRQAFPPAAGRRGPTYFEVTTAAALLHFAREKVDIAVLEVGLGGRLDSTNICLPEVSVITSISFDHTRQLGNTLAEIASEKAGIIKPGVPVVSGVTQAEPRQVITRTASLQQSDCFSADEDFFVEYHGIPAGGSGIGAGAVRPLACIDYRESPARGGRRLSRLQLGLYGRHQAENAAVALAALGRLQPGRAAISEAAIREGLGAVRVPARFEIFPGMPTLVVDAAHNVASTAALVATLEECFPDRRTSRTLVFATSLDKDVPGMLGLLVGRFERIILTRYLNNPRFVPPEHLLNTLEGILEHHPGPRPEIEIRDDPAAAWAAIPNGRPASLVCVTGSFFLAAEMRQLIRSREAIPAADVG